jgi:hypothetical protein
MSDSATLLGNLADACLKQADRLQSMQKDMHFQGPQCAQLAKNEGDLRTQSLALNTAAVAAALQESQEAQTQLKNGTAAANTATAAIKSAEEAIQLSSDLIGLAASAVSGNPQGIIASATQLIGDAGRLTG